MNYAFYISGKSSRVKKILLQANDKMIKNVRVIISDYIVEDELRKICDDRKIEICEMNYPSIPKDNNADKNIYFSDYMLRKLEENNIDYCFSFGSHLLAGELLKVYAWKLINFHPAILPMYPGVNAIDQAVEHGNTFIIGNTAHFIDEGMDTGKIIMQSVTTMQSFIDSKYNYDVVLDLQIEMFNELIRVLNAGRLEIVNGNVRIVDADYNCRSIYPKLV